MLGSSSIHGNSMVGMQEQHPYDMPYSKMVEMRQDIQDLKSMLMAEQQQRASEVAELRLENQKLREALKNETKQREMMFEKLVKDLQPEKKGNEFDELRTTLKHQVHQLEHDLADEIRHRKASEAMLESKEAAREADIRNILNTITHDLGKHKQTFGSVKQDHANLINNCIHDIHLLAGGMQRITQSWVSTPVDNLETNEIMRGTGAGSPTKKLG